jgi:hypothetical protein
MISLSDYSWKKCIICGHFYRFKRRKNEAEGQVRMSTSLGCLVCNYRDKKEMYYRRIMLDLQNKVHKDGEWVVAKNEERFEARINETLKWAYFDLGAIIAEDVFYRAIDDYWYSIYFTLEQSRQS